MEELLKDLVSFDDAVDLLRDVTNRNTLRHYVQQRKITHVKLFGRIYFRLSDLVAYYESGIKPAYSDPPRERKPTYAEDLARLDEMSE